MEKILLFIPGYNCAKQIPRVLSQIDSDVLKYIFEIIFVNNRSKDNTEEVVLDFIEKNPNINLKILRNDDNYGLGGSHKVAFNYAIKNKFDYVIVLHGDDQGDIKDLIPYLKSGEYKKYDNFLGSRFMKGSKLKGYSKFRTFGNKVFNFLFSVILLKKITDLGSGLNIYKTEFLKSKFYEKFPDNLTFNCYMLLAAKYYKHKIMFFPLSWREEDQVSNVKIINQAKKTFLMLLKYALNPKKYMGSDLRDKKVNEYTSNIIKRKDNKNEKKS